MPSRAVMFLRPVLQSARHPEIQLPNAASVCVGRNRESALKDRRLSRKQLQLRAEYSTESVKLLVLGSNPSAVNGETAKKGAQRNIRLGDQLEMLEGKHCYVLAMRGQHSSAENGGQKAEQAVGEAANQVESGGVVKAPAKVSTTHGYNHWSQGLLAAMNDPKLIIEQDEDLVVINDRYPKARYHFLVLPKERIHDLNSVEAYRHIRLLRRLHAKGEELVKRTRKLQKGLEFRLGYHAVPSMSQLHLHVISQDFDSTCLKNKKHWNSFTTDYFIPSESVLRELEEGDKITTMDHADAKKLLEKDLRCHKCEYKPKNLPDLKKHVKNEHFP